MALSGLGTDTSQLAISAASIAAPVAITAATVGIASIVPVIGPALAGITLAINAILNSGCGQTCVITSNWANQAEDQLRQNIQAYFAIPAPRPRAAQAAALSNFDRVWAYLSQECSSPQVGDAGKACISDRQSGACKWKQTASSVLLSIPGEPQPGACWNWFSGYRDPIANDTQVTDTDTSNQALGAMGSDPASAITQAVQSGGLGGALGGTNVLLLIGGALLLMGVAK